MSNLVPIQITLQAATAADAKQLVQDLAGTMSGMPASGIPSETTVSKVEPEKPRRQKAANTAPETSEETPDEAASAQEDVEIPSVVDLRAKAQQVGQDPKKKPKIKALLDKYGSPNVSEVPEDKRAAFLADLEKL